MKKLFRHWKIIYAVCCFAYMGWMIHVGGNEFDRINSQYRHLNDQLDGERIKAGALEELAAECRRDTKDRQDMPEISCSAWPLPVVQAKSAEIEERRSRARERGFIKLMLFYTGFVSIFLVGPPLFIYLLLVGAIKLYRSIKIVR